MHKFLLSAAVAGMLACGLSSGAAAYDGHWHGAHGEHRGGGWHEGHGWHHHGYYGGPVVVGGYAPYGYYPAYYPYAYQPAYPVAYPAPYVAPVGLSLGFSFH